MKRWRSEVILSRVFPTFSLSVVVVLLIHWLRRIRPDIDNKNFWWDEAGQFWMSMGQMHTSDHLTPHASVLDGIAAGRSGFNLDPPGFTLLLRVWIESFGTSAGSLRVLPLVFAIGSLVVSWLILISLIKLSPTFWAILPLTCWPLFESEFVHYATELRPYSAELFFTMVTSLVGIRAIMTRHKISLFAFGLSIGVGILFSRYTAAVFMLAALIALILVLNLCGNHPREVWPLYASLPIALSPVAVLYFTSGHSTPGYVRELTLLDNFSLTFVAKTLKNNFLEGSHLATGVILFLAVFAALRRLWNCRLSEPGKVQKTAATGGFGQQQLAVVFLKAVVAIATLGWALASILGLNTWLKYTRWSIGLITAAWISICLLGSIAQDQLTYFWGRRRSTFGEQKKSLFILCCLVATLVGIASFLSRNFERPAYSSLSPDTYVIFENEVAHALVPEQVQSSEPLPVTVVAPTALWPTLRMIWETDVYAGLRELSITTAIRYTNDSDFASSILDWQADSCAHSHLIVITAEELTEPICGTIGATVGRSFVLKIPVADSENSLS